MSAGPGRRKEKKDTLNAARRSMAMAEEVKVAVGAAQANHKRFESPPQWLSTPSSSNSSPRSLILSPATLPLEDAWAAISDVAGQSGCFVWPCGHKGPWRKNHAPCSFQITDTTRRPGIKWPSRCPHIPTSHSSRHRNGSGQCSVRLLKHRRS
jgi:hypothetical protein